MERIQAAIAKARASRTSSGPQDPARPRTLSLRRSEEVDAAWEALPLKRVDDRQLEDNRLLGARTEQTAEGAAYDVLRTRTLKLMQENGWKRLAVTSPSPACGKSTVVINLGMGLTRRADVSAIIMEADMRRPSLAKKLGIRERYETVEVLRRRGSFAQNACRIGERLAISTNTGPVRNSSDILQAPATGAVLDEIEATYAPTMMLFDMPPLLANDDTIAFLPFVDCAILVAAAEHTTSKEIDACERELAAHTNVLGVVLNKCKFAGNKYGYDYY